MCSQHIWILSLGSSCCLSYHRSASVCGAFFTSKITILPGRFVTKTNWMLMANVRACRAAAKPGTDSGVWVIRLLFFTRAFVYRSSWESTHRKFPHRRSEGSLLGRLLHGVRGATTEGNTRRHWCLGHWSLGGTVGTDYYKFGEQLGKLTKPWLSLQSLPSDKMVSKFEIWKSPAVISQDWKPSLCNECHGERITGRKEMHRGTCK